MPVWVSGRPTVTCKSCSIRSFKLDGITSNVHLGSFSCDNIVLIVTVHTLQGLEANNIVRLLVLLHFGEVILFLFYPYYQVLACWVIIFFQMHKNNFSQSNCTDFCIIATVATFGNNNFYGSII